MDKKFVENLNMLIRVFNGRPNHLSKYLLDNKAFNEDFIRKISDSDKFEIQDINNIYFLDIDQMNNHFNSIIKSNSVESVDEILMRLNMELDKSIKEERYEDSIKIRDYMSRNGIMRSNID